ncbi:hypothetical protein KQ51_00958 [Candidatus Izimaplasma bacterium HR1]|jgi:hypothetical protein|uniref:hypothetical protein n=1 Tax=Candidatus Izimoplasma sp. HR1 TaxID=1541959 RepID=UPI0004F90566|nr:hypothetical protein KQ51_00958 [Candidatus Izimaplasma bacterium HR1]
MKKYFKYYNILRLTTPSKKGFFYTLLFVLLNIIVYNKFVSLTDMFTTGFAVMFFWSLFAVIYYVYLIQSESSHPIYQFPLDNKDRVINGYISVFFTFLGVVVIMVLLASTTLLLFTLLTDVQNNTVNDPFYLAGTIYSIGYSFIVLAAFMPTAFMINVKMRYIHGFLSIMALVVFNYTITWILTGRLNIDANMSINMEDTSYGLFLSIVVLFISVLALLVSYSTSKKLSS